MSGSHRHLHRQGTRRPSIKDRTAPSIACIQSRGNPHAPRRFVRLRYFAAAAAAAANPITTTVTCIPIHPLHDRSQRHANESLPLPPPAPPPPPSPPLLPPPLIAAPRAGTSCTSSSPQHACMHAHATNVRPQARKHNWQAHTARLHGAAGAQGGGSASVTARGGAAGSGRKRREGVYGGVKKFRARDQQSQHVFVGREKVAPRDEGGLLRGRG